MRASSMRYLMGNGFRNLWHNRLMTIASVGTLVACLLIVGVAVLFFLKCRQHGEICGGTERTGGLYERRDFR